MSRRRRDVVVFDLEDPGAPRAEAADDVAPDPAEQGRPARSRARRVREAVVAGAVVVVAVAAWGVTTAVHEHQRQERLLTAPGGVLSLAHPPARIWSARTDDTGTTEFMPGLVVVRRGTALVGLDTATGAQRWQVEVGGDPRCGPALWGRSTATVADPLVCWSGPNAAESTVVVVHADGSATTRPLTETFDAAAGTVDGGLVTMRRIGPPAPTSQVMVTAIDPGGFSLAGSVTEGQDVLVRWEDAATGAVRWERTLPFQPVADANACGVTITQTDEGELATANLTQVAAAAYPGLVVVTGCGIQGAFASDGTPMSDPASSAWSWAEPYVDGGVLEQVGAYTEDSSVASLLHGADGAGVTTFSSPVLQPWATDGSPSDVVLTGSGGALLQARGRDGTLRWESAHRYSDILVRTGGMLLAARDGFTLAGVDPGTGRELWSRDDILSDDPMVASRSFLTSAFTDGSLAMLVAAHDDPSTPAELVAVDLATGDVRWRTPAASSWPRLYAADGRLVEVADGDSAGGRYEDDGHGGTVLYSPGTVTALG